MKYYVTKEGLDELLNELDQLKKVDRVEIADRLKRAKEYGDLSENAEYIDAKDAQAKLETRIFELEENIRNSVVIRKSKSKDIVSIGSTIDVQKGLQTKRYTIVGSEEANPEKNLISNESPLGRSFLGRKPGETVEIVTPNGRVKYKVVGIE